ncbi:MAG: TolC family protein [Desulfobacteraceae bacterium]|nr:MAG: TolC family protein [Desulfobacteraceae bacterium]
MITLLVLMSAFACAPDRWRVFDYDDNRFLRGEADRPITIPETVRPKLTEPPSFEIPSGEGPMDLSIELAAMLALSHNRDLQVRQINPVIAGTFEQLERGKFDPELFAQFEYTDERAMETSRATGEKFPVDGNDNSTAAGVRQTLPTGTQLEASVAQQRSISNRTPEEQDARIGMSITQSLLQGFGPAVNLVSVRQAEIDASASLYELRGFVEAMLAETEITYWNFVLAGKEVTIFEQSLTIARQQLDEVEQQIEVGLLPEVEAAAARAEVARREQALIEARSLLEERRLKLLRLTNPKPEDGFNLRINASSEPAIEPEPITDLADRLELAGRSRPDLNEARLRLRQNRLETIVTKNGLLPRLELFAVLGQTGYADSFSNSFKELNNDTYDYSVGIRFSQYLGNRSAKASDLAARASSRQAAEAVENLAQIVSLDVRLAANEVERTRQQIAASRVTRILQERTLEAETERFRVGSSTSLLIAQAQRDLLVARIAEVMSVVNYRIALVQLNLAEGTLLERRGVKLAEGITP